MTPGQAYEALYAIRWHAAFPRNLKLPRGSEAQEAARAGGMARGRKVSVRDEMMRLDYSKWRYTSDIAAELGIKTDTCRNRLKSLRQDGLLISRDLNNGHSERLQWRKA